MKNREAEHLSDLFIVIGDFLELGKISYPSQFDGLFIYWLLSFIVFVDKNLSGSYTHFCSSEVLSQYIINDMFGDCIGRKNLFKPRISLGCSVV